MSSKEIAILELLKKPIKDREDLMRKKRKIAKQFSIGILKNSEIFSEVARRWKAQFNENSKNWAFSETFPELNHNAVIGYEFPFEAKERIFVLLLRSSSFHPRSLLRYEATVKLLAKAGIAYEFVEAMGRSSLAQVMSLVLLGDYSSFYLAMLNGVDPTPIDSINFVKQYLAQFSTPALQKGENLPVKEVRVDEIPLPEDGIVIAVQGEKVQGPPGPAGPLQPCRVHVLPEKLSEDLGDHPHDPTPWFPPSRQGRGPDPIE